MRAMSILRGLLAAGCLAASFAHAKVGLTPDSMQRLQAATAAAQQQPAPPTLSREVLLRRPDVWGASLSPTGKQVVYFQYDEARTDAWLYEVSSGERTRILRDVRQANVVWAGNGAHLWVADARGLAVVEVASKKATPIVQWNAARQQRLFAIDANAPQFAVIHEQPGQKGEAAHRYWRVDTQGKTTLLLDAAVPQRHILLRADGTVAFTAGYEGPAFDTVIRRHEQDGTHDVLRCQGLSVCTPVRFDATHEALFVLAQTEDRYDLRRWKAGQWSQEHTDPLKVADTDTVLFAKHTWRAISYRGATSVWYGQDAATTQVLNALRTRFPGATLDLDSSTDGQVWLVKESNATLQHPRYWLHRHGTTTAFHDAAPPVQSAQLHPAIPVSWTTQDGMRLHGYVHLPKGRKASDVPLVAWLHGGPHARLFDDFDPQHQLLANRGVAVFVPNFRGSSGYGKRYALSAGGDVGKGKVLQDVLDGLDSVLAAGVGDATRQAVMGHSFGAYLALLAATHTPDRFDSVFAAAPPTDYGWVKQWQASHDARSAKGEMPLAVSFDHYGFPFRDSAWKAAMTKDSPLANLDRLNAPLYIWSGTHDDRVPLKSIAHYASEASRLGKPVNLLIDTDSGHTPAPGPLNTEAFFYLIEQAAHRAFATPVEKPTAELAAFLAQRTRLEAKAP